MRLQDYILESKDHYSDTMMRHDRMNNPYYDSSKDKHLPIFYTTKVNPLQPHLLVEPEQEGEAYQTKSPNEEADFYFIVCGSRKPGWNLIHIYNEDINLKHFEKKFKDELNHHFKYCKKEKPSDIKMVPFGFYIYKEDLDSEEKFEVDYWWNILVDAINNNKPLKCGEEKGQDFKFWIFDSKKEDFIKKL